MRRTREFYEELLRGYRNEPTPSLKHKQAQAEEVHGKIGEYVVDKSDPGAPGDGIRFANEACYRMLTDAIDAVLAERMEEGVRK